MNYYFYANIKKLNIFFILLILITSLSLPVKQIQAKENEVIKVGYPIVNGFTELNNGSYRGYAFEYLFEISKYTGWKYELIEMPLSTALDKLQSGEIDIVAGMIKNDKTEELFDFPNLNSGYTHSTLATLNTNNTLSYYDISTLNGIKIGYFDRTQSNLSKLEEFFTSNNIKNITYKSYPSNDSEALINALKLKEVDAIITGDLLLNNDLKILKKFDSLPYYFATTKGKTHIKNGLNDAINKINESDPDFALNIYSKYFQTKVDTSIILTKDEQKYLSNLGTLKAIYVDNFYPIQYYDKTKGEADGVIVNIGKLVFEKLGIDFELIRANNFEEAFKLINENPNYLAIGLPVDYNTSTLNNILFSKSYLDLSIVKVYSKSYSKDKDKILALPYGYGYNELNNGFKIKYYDTIEDCLIAVEKNEAYFTYSNYYTISKYMSTNFLSNTSIVADEHSNFASFAFSFNVDRNLFNIINKAIMSIPNDEIRNIIYTNSSNSKLSITLKVFFLSNLTLCLTIISIILIIIVLLISIIVRLKFKTLKTKKNILLSKSQIDQLSGLYNRNTCEELIKNYLSKIDNSVYFSFIIIDIDYFKQINDKFGHQAGDNLLREFSSLLKEVFSSEDIISRWGGDEFIIFIKDINKNNINTINKRLEKLSKLMNKEIEYNGITQKISLSIGAIISKDINDFNKLYKEADEALYDVKRSGRNGYKIK